MFKKIFIYVFACISWLFLFVVVVEYLFIHPVDGHLHSSKFWAIMKTLWTLCESFCVDICSFSIVFLEFSKYLTVFSANTDIFTYFFLIYQPIVSSSCFIALAKTSSMILNRSDGSGCTGNVSNIRRKAFNISLLTMMLTINFHRYLLLD